jgi:hypothetical protein
VRILASLVLLGLIGCDQAAGGNDPGGDEARAAEYRSRRVERAVDGAAEVVETRGFAAAGERWRGFLVEHGSDVREEPMRAGTCYVVLAASSTSVRELTLRVFDSDGGAVVADATGPSPRCAPSCGRDMLRRGAGRARDWPLRGAHLPRTNRPRDPHR